MIFKYLNNTYSVNELMEIPSGDQWLRDIQGFLKKWLNEKDYVSVNTSGSTGKPKPIRLLKSSMKISAGITNNYFNLNNRHTAILCLPAKYIAGKLMIIRALESGMQLIIKKPATSPIGTLKDKIDFIAMTPMQVEATWNRNPELFKLIETIIIGGGAVSKPLMDKLQTVHSRCYQTYGMTETITHVALQQINGRARTDYFNVLEGFKIDQDERGCLTIEAAHIHNHLVTTNDLVDLIDEKSFRWLGRYDNVINTGGIKVFPEKIESKMQDFIVSPFFVIGKPDNQLGEQVTLCVESEPWDTTSAAAILNQIDSRLSKYERPRSILFFECFLYTENGKVRRRATLDNH